MDTGRKEPIGKNNLRIRQVAGLDVILRTMRAGGKTVVVNGGEAPPLQQEAASETVYALVATTGNIGSIGTAGPLTIDGTATPENTLVMVRAQSIETENGIYEVREDGWRKVSTDGDKFLVFVGAGLTYGNTLWFTSDGVNFYRPRADILNASVTDDMIGTRTANDALESSGGAFLTLTQKLTGFLSVIFSMFKAITGKSAGNIVPDITLAATKTHVDASAPHTGHEIIDNKGQVDGYCELDITAKIPAIRIPATLNGVNVAGFFSRGISIAPDGGAGTHTLDATTPICLVDTTASLSVGIMGYTVFMPPFAGVGTIPVGTQIDIIDWGGLCATGGKNITINLNGSSLQDGITTTKVLNTNKDGIRFIMDTNGHWLTYKITNA